MNGKTHEAVGIATAMVSMSHWQLKDMMIGCLIASAAATIPDADLIDNRKGKGLSMVVEVVKQSMIPICLGIMFDAPFESVIAWLAAMVVIVLQPHRGFSHSIWCMLIMSGLIVYMMPDIYLEPFIASYGSHLAIDLLNTKDEKILYPKGFCFNVCKSGGALDWAIGAIASITIVIMATTRICDIKPAMDVLKGVL